jgi:hypothetical protein
VCISHQGAFNLLWAWIWLCSLRAQADGRRYRYSCSYTDTVVDVTLLAELIHFTYNASYTFHIYKLSFTGMAQLLTPSPAGCPCSFIIHHVTFHPYILLVYRPFAPFPSIQQARIN